MPLKYLWFDMTINLFAIFGAGVRGECNAPFRWTRAQLATSETRHQHDTGLESLFGGSSRGKSLEAWTRQRGDISAFDHEEHD